MWLCNDCILRVDDTGGDQKSEQPNRRKLKEEKRKPVGK